MLRMKNRKGAILVLASFTIVTLVIMLAFVVDLSRMFVQKNELQTGSDAAAISGALQIANYAGNIGSSATTTGNLNKVLGRAPTFTDGSIMCGVWDGFPIDGVTPNTWHSGSPHALPCVAADNAVQVSGSDPTSYLFSSVLNAANQQVKTVAVAWVAPTVDRTSCIKPLGVNYDILLSALDQFRTTPRNPLRVLDGIDYTTLHTQSDKLTFCLKDGSDKNQKCKNSALTSGSFGIVGLKPGDNGGSTYRGELGADCSEDYPIGQGDNIDVLTGNAVGPTNQGVDQYCGARTPCLMKFVLYDGTFYAADKPATDGRNCTGADNGTNVCYKIITIGAAVIDYPQIKGLGNGVITGHFTIANDPGGSIGTKPGLLQTVILVK